MIDHNKITELIIERDFALHIKMKAQDEYIKNMTLKNYNEMRKTDEIYSSFRRKIYTHDILKHLVDLKLKNESEKQIVFNETEHFIINLIFGRGLPYFSVYLKDLKP